MKKAQAPTIWVVMHCEVALTMQGPIEDRALFFAGSSRQSAFRFMKKMRVEPGTWWAVSPCELDSEEYPGVGESLYSRNCRPLRSRPFDAGHRSALLQCRRDIERIERQLRRPGRESLTRKTIAILRETVRGMKRVLSRSR